MHVNSQGIYIPIITSGSKFLCLASWFHCVSPATAALCTLLSAPCHSRYQSHPLLFNFLQTSPTELLWNYWRCWRFASTVIFYVAQGQWNSMNLKWYYPHPSNPLPIPASGSSHWLPTSSGSNVLPQLSLILKSLDPIFSYFPHKLIFLKFTQLQLLLSIHRDSLMCFSGGIIFYTPFSKTQSWQRLCHFSLSSSCMLPIPCMVFSINYFF